MQIEVIERYVDQVLEVNGMVKGTEEQLRLLLSHLYTAVGMYQLLDKDQKLLVAKIQKQLRHFFYAKCDLKERKSKKDKEKTPLHPSIKEKETKEKEQKTHTHAERDFSSSLDERKKAFLEECDKHCARYGEQIVGDFFSYWSEENKKDGKMLFEYEKTWNTAKRIYKWANNPISCAKRAALLRLDRVKNGKKKKEVDTTKLQQEAALRDEANERLFQTIEENKRNAVSHEEYLKQKQLSDEYKE